MAFPIHSGPFLKRLAAQIIRVTKTQDGVVSLLPERTRSKAKDLLLVSYTSKALHLIVRKVGQQGLTYYILMVSLFVYMTERVDVVVVVVVVVCRSLMPHGTNTATLH